MATKPRIAPDGAAARDRGIRIFLSYKSEDEDRAKQLETTLRAAGQDRIDVFRARQIPYGANWRSLIREKIADSDILLLLYTDDSRSWARCLFECGMFLRSVDEAESPLICLHHPEARPPDALSHLQSFTATKDNARKLLECLLIKYPHDHRARPINPNLFTDDYRPILDLYCGQIIKATGEKAEQYYVHDAWLTTRVCLEDVIIRQDDRGRTTYHLRPDVRVEMSFSLAALLGLQQSCLGEALHELG